MAFDTALLKRHWLPITGGAVAIFLLVYLYSKKSSSAATPSGTDLSGGASSGLNYAAAADVTNAQTNAQVENSAYAANVADNQTAAALQASLAKTAATLSATNGQTSAAEIVDLAAINAGVTTAKITATADVQKVAIEANTVDTLAADQTQIQKAIIGLHSKAIDVIGSQVDKIFGRSNFDSNIQAFAPVAALELGMPDAAVGVSFGNASQVAAGNSGAAVGGSAAAILSAIKPASIISGLFGG